MYGNPHMPIFDGSISSIPPLVLPTPPGLRANKTPHSAKHCGTNCHSFPSTHEGQQEHQEKHPHLKILEYLEDLGIFGGIFGENLEISAAIQICSF